MPPPSLSRSLESPLDVSLVRTQISHYVAMKDALSCICVCKDWANDFIPSIWHTIDFEVQKSFQSLSMDVISKYGHHIRLVKNITTFAQLISIQNVSITKLARISMVVDVSMLYQAHSYDILHRNIASLENIELKKALNNNSALFLLSGALSPIVGTKVSPRFSYLKFVGITMTRDAFSLLLRTSPVLDTISLEGCVLLSSPITDMYQHPSLTHVIASISQVFHMDQETIKRPSLFAHFPNLTTWTLWSKSSPTLDVPVSTIKAEISQSCPQLKILNMNLLGPFVVDFLIHGFDDLIDVCFPHGSFTPPLTIAILSHKDTLERIMTKASDGFYESDIVHPVDNYFKEYSWAVNTMLQLCSHLKTIKFPQLEMNMDDIEKIKWTCTDLAELHIRICGLDTAEKINRAIQLWTDGRRRKIQMHILDTKSTNDKYCLSLEERVAKYLLKFNKLKEVWLGTYIHRVA